MVNHKPHLLGLHNIYLHATLNVAELLVNIVWPHLYSVFISDNDILNCRRKKIFRKILVMYYTTNFHVHIWQSNVRLFWNAIMEKNVLKIIFLIL